LPLRKAAGVLRQGFGLSITDGGLSHLLHRVSKKAQATYDELLEQIRKSPAVYAYHVDESKGRPVAENILGEKFPGVLVTDCAALYWKR
jgi:hypothetical protein